ncbi:MAG: sporulation protein [Candidatus Thermoplasmatota archaeon]|nr:sporulation protein [Candidatus Thermoplasmatota archaeon]
MGLKSRVLDTLGLQTVHADIKVKGDHIFKGSPFQVEVVLTGGKKGAVVNRVGSTVFFQTIVHDTSAAILLLEFLGAAGEIIGGGIGGSGHLGDKVLRIPLHEASLKKNFKLGPGKRKTLKVTPTVPDEYPFGYSSRIVMKVEVNVQNAPDIFKEKRIDILPNIFISAPLMVLMKKYGFLKKELRDTTIQEVPEDRFLLIASERSHQRIKEITLTSTDLKDGRMEYVLAFEMFEKPDGILKGKHETVMVHFELNRDQLMKIDGTIDMSLIEEKVQEAFDEAEGKFGKVYGGKM